MNRKSVFTLMALFSILLLVGCKADKPSQNVEAESTKGSILYENKNYDLSIKENADWKFKSDADTNNLNVILSHGKSQAIISSVSSDRTFADIKQELKASTENIEIISEENNTLSYQSTFEDAVRTDVYFKEHNKSVNLIIIFMSPVSAYEQTKPNIESLLNHIK
ncbi:hypothetical protein [Paraliobacillus sp. JSM ZJ581]|uniref:hypothetical protein n=1 Tax=Paraliobacillus sp. JSM ZJ581 TaxID=3342118 RepID=UPI0035A85530